MTSTALQVFAEVRALHAAIKVKTGAMVGIEVKDGLFRVLETTMVGRKHYYKYLSGLQSHADCVQVMRELAA